MGVAAVIDTDVDTDLPIPKRARWKLDPRLEPDVQKLVVSGFGGLSAARALLIHAQSPGGGWVAALKEIVPVTPADARGSPALALAFTSLGLEKLGLPPALVAQFALPFTEGMMQASRRDRLGDVDGSVKTPIAWGPRADRLEAGTLEASCGSAAPGSEVHALALIYDQDHVALDGLVRRIAAALAGAGVTILRDKTLDMMGDNLAKSREHFGFVDGISQPIPYGKHTRDDAGAEVKPDPLHGVPLGEILLGYPDAHANTTRGPTLRGKWDDGAFVPTPPGEATAALLADDLAEVRQDLTRNGTYLVVRELDQDVKGFWDSMEKAARPLNQKAEWMAERVVGRTLDGDLLRPRGPLAPTTEGPDNDFLFFLADRGGHGCPMGSHIRRANPRDGLAPKADFCEGLLRSANAHRLLRRGRKYGGGIAGSPTKGDEGLLFICLNTDIARQFEFVQQNWMLNPNFATLYDEVDPLVGPAGKMTLPATPLRRRVEVATFVKLVGGDYFFLPSLSTLRILAALPGQRTG